MSYASSSDRGYTWMASVAVVLLDMLSFISDFACFACTIDGRLRSHGVFVLFCFVFVCFYFVPWFKLLMALLSLGVSCPVVLFRLRVI